MRRYLLVFAVLGLVGCFLPIVGGTSLNLFDLPSRLSYRTLHPWLVAAAFAAPALATWRASRAAVIVAAVCFGYLALRLGPHSLDLVLYAGLGGKLIGIAVVGGLLATVGALLESTRRSQNTVQEYRTIES